MAQGLASVYVNESRVGLQGDPKPKVAKIVKTAGQEPQMTQVFRLKERSDPKGTPLNLEEVIDRTKEQQDIYLRCVDKSGAGPATGAAPGNYRTETAMENLTPEASTTGEFGGSKPQPPAPPVPGRTSGAWPTEQKQNPSKEGSFGPAQYGGAGNKGSNPATHPEPRTESFSGEKRNPTTPTNPPGKGKNPNKSTEENTETSTPPVENRREGQ